jgi:hydrogenase maturation protease
MGEGARKVAVIGYGNPGRLDDGLGPALAAALEKRGMPGLTVEADYQLGIDTARTVAEHDVVVFADASLIGPEPFSFRRIGPKASAHFSSHIVEPEGVLALAQEVFRATPEAYVLGIRGYEFDEFGESLSERAEANLAAALEFIERVVCDGSYSEAEAELGKQSVVDAAASDEDGRCKTENT